MSLMTYREDVTIRIIRKMYPSFYHKLTSEYRCRQGLDPPSRAADVDMYTCRRYPHIDYAQQQLRGHPLLVGLCSGHHLLERVYPAQLTSRLVHIYKCVQIRAMFLILCMHARICPFTYRTNTQKGIHEACLIQALSVERQLFNTPLQ